jgi:hypothetical protein
MSEITEAPAPAPQALRPQDRQTAFDNNPLEVQKRIELRVTKSFFDAIGMLSEDEGSSKADIIRKAVSLYARARIEQKQGNLIAFVRAEEGNKVEVQSIIASI